LKGRSTRYDLDRGNGTVSLRHPPTHSRAKALAKNTVTKHARERNMVKSVKG